MKNIEEDLCEFIKDVYSKEFVALHEPTFIGSEKINLEKCIESTFVSSVGSFVTEFGEKLASYTNSPSATPCINGTAALHASLLLAGVEPGDLVITQALTFVATANAIKYCGADPIFVDVDVETMGMSPSALKCWLESRAYIDDDGFCRTKIKHQKIKACVPMHTFGHAVRINELIDICENWHLCLVEDAAEALGSKFDGKHLGTFGIFGTLSFNGNKIITTGHGGAILSSSSLGKKALHLTTTAKVSHPYEYIHDQVGYNYRMANVNAAIGCAQLEFIDTFVKVKRDLASQYGDFFANTDYCFVKEPESCVSNYWLNAVVCPSKKERDDLLKSTNAAGVMTRPIWKLMSDLCPFSHCLKGDLKTSQWLFDHVVCLPSGVNSEALAG